MASITQNSQEFNPKSSIWPLKARKKDPICSTRGLNLEGAVIDPSPSNFEPHVLQIGSFFWSLKVKILLLGMNSCEFWVIIAILTTDEIKKIYINCSNFGLAVTCHSATSIFKFMIDELPQFIYCNSF